MAAIELMGIKTDSWGPIISCLISKKWDAETNRLYESSIKDPLVIQCLEDQINFLRNRFQSLEATPNSPRLTATNAAQNKRHKIVCSFCQDQHTISYCPKFRGLSGTARSQAIREKNLCNNCLWHDAAAKCTSERRCAVCSRRHHTLLHFEKTEHKTQSKSPIVLLANALIKATTVSGGVEYARVLIDQGSQAFLITEEAATLLALPRQKVSTDLSGVGDGDIKTSSQQVTLTCSPRFPSTFKLTTNLLVLPKLTRTLPEKSFDIDMEQWQNKVLADPTLGWSRNELKK
ncbi:unnamed protein product [Brassicogethes aeneus]|uniref:Peptidase aspartic putative domain-containing protein n=1 Tax=Brassicogethes aeneus TaxID=1431903 RepID=A0A9P0BCM6_BRAAE|nr:unnamed protein product [Brassicogethes aeneus]